MKRLGFLAAHCPKNQKRDDIFNRGANIFHRNEKDVKSASKFLLVLLNSIETWATLYSQDRITGEETIFWQVYKDLRSKQCSFPSEQKGYEGGEVVDDITVTKNNLMTELKIKMKMKRVRDIAEKSQEYVDQLERPDFTTPRLNQDSHEEDRKHKRELSNTIMLCEVTIQDLMKE